ncbi:udp-n-acetylglucosamine 1-carboxyvinyltransferase [Heliomicrobium modesticaldum Ice1]|uniref:UDP-N-acetylglucosamine 1-carboxyvinyltransferase n=1 Tax=Heliobacterium modesticaldum (strain ATCC 51547 / Ice1) TaxID=498761 RepID=B0TA44_HELMI|nr:UDP-N-acetylglucosamine 1-carboxyvinyltransferase [Heliomicrobium modesticaldum]ABZ83581.1 udp-n-acetylglucosamine 1-carboxyvinyltransferase [Heliomicrobium modesticaldum Ice1]
MGKLLIQGGIPLEGRVPISGAKNSTLPVMAACFLAQGETILENIPEITDVDVVMEICREMGGEGEWLERGVIRLHVPDTISCKTSYTLAKKLRASNLLLGALLGRFGWAEVALPGGDNIGTRPMDLHIKGLSVLGAELKIEHGYIRGGVAGGKRLKGGKIYLDFPSVGATENIMMAAAMAQGQTIIENCAKEPEIVDLANFLNAMGARIRGAGTDVIRVDGVSELRGTRYTVIPDRIEAGTYMIAAAATHGRVIVENVIPTHLHAITSKLREIGVRVEEGDDQIFVDGAGLFRPVDVKTLPYPGFPTDMQSPLMALLSTVKGISMIVENVYENRLRVVDELQRMGAQIKIEGRTAVIDGVARLSSAQVKASDLRAGAALIIAGLMADGETEVSCLHHVLRGYAHLEEKLTGLGARVRRIS